MSDDGRDFDLDAWIDDASLPETSVTVVGDGKLKAEYEELDEQFRRARATYADADRLVDPTTDIAAQMLAVNARMKASERTFRFRALTRAESKTIIAEAPKDDSGEPDADYLAAAWLAASSVYPRMTPEQAAKIRAKIGEGQFGSMWAAAWGISNDRRPDVPFSLAASVALNSKDS
jgi:hypothetical protein